MDNLAAAPAPVETVDRTVPAGIVTPAKKGGKGAVVLAVLFALIAVGLGVWLAIMLLNPPKKDNCEVSGNNSGGSSNVAETNESDVDAVLNLLDEIDEPFVGYSSENEYYDAGLPIKVNDNLWASAVMTYGATVKVYDDSDSDAKQMRSSAINTLKKNGLTSVAGPSIMGYGDDASYYENSDSGLYCYVGNVNGVTGYKSAGYSWFTYQCTNKNWLTDENKQLAIDLAAAYHKSDDGKEYKINYISDTLTRKIKKNDAGTYEHITVGFENAAALFYRKVGGEWKYFTATQQAISCKQYNTAELKEAYKGEKCWDENKGDDVVLK